MAWNVLIAVLVVLQIAGMAWACKTCGGWAHDYQGRIVTVFLVIFWPLLWLAKHIDWPVQ